MRKILYSLSVLFCLILSSCFGDLDTMPLDESQLVTEKYIALPKVIPEYLQNVMHH